MRTNNNDENKSLQDFSRYSHGFHVPDVWDHCNFRTSYITLTCRQFWNRQQLAGRCRKFRRPTPARRS